MKIGILTSGNDMLTLFSFLQRYDHEYHIWYDDKFLFWGDKSLSLVVDRIKEGIDFLQKKGVEAILVPPMVELKIHNEHLFPGIAILPLFSSYVLEHSFTYSLVGKIGFLGDWVDLIEGQQQLINLAKNYELSPHQRETRKFHNPFVYWSKEVRNWKYLLDTCSWSMPLVNHLIKQDLRYFKDAHVDTIIPCNYSYFHAEKVIKKAIYSHMRFGGIEIVEQMFVKLVEKKKTSPYGVTFYFTGHGKFFTEQKKLVWLLGRGKGSSPEYVYL